MNLWFLFKFIDLVLTESGVRPSPYICWGANKVCDLCNNRLQSRENLNRRSSALTLVSWSSGVFTCIPIANQANVFSSHDHIVLPICRMQQLTLVGLQARNLWPSPMIQISAGIDKNIARFFIYCSGTIAERWVFYGNFPIPRCFYPLNSDDLVLQFDKTI